MVQPHFPLLVTHSGTFHCDDALAYAALRLALGLGVPGSDHSLVRTRDSAIVARADLVWDVGGEFDAARGRFDHHQRGAPVRGDGLPFSSAGLVWREHGEAAVRALLGAEAAGTVARVAAGVDREVVRRVDEIDNGVAHPCDTLGLSSLVEDFNPPWDSPAVGDQAAEDAAFVRAADAVEGFLRRRAEAIRARLVADALVAAAHARSEDLRILELGRKMPWQAAVLGHGLADVLYAVYPVPNGNWMVDAMPPAPDSFAQRLPLPEAWAGLRDGELAEACGVPDAVFVHPKRFVGAARSRAGAMEMARLAVAAGAPACGAPGRAHGEGHVR